MTKAERYVINHLAAELEEVQASPIANIENGLTLYEKTLIYHYTKDGYASINPGLRDGAAHSELTVLLERSLKKLPNYENVVHRTAFLGKAALQPYRDAATSGKSIVDPAFISTSHSPKTARLMPRWNTKFRMISRQAKLIEDISYNGSHGVVNEKEVLFCPGTRFEVLQVTTMANYVLIEMVEI